MEYNSHESSPPKIVIIIAYAFSMTGPIHSQIQGTAQVASGTPNGTPRIG